MAKITSHRALRFEVEGKQHHVSPSPHVQHVPDWVTGHPYFQAAVESKWIELHDAPEESQDDAPKDDRSKGRGKKKKPEDSADEQSEESGEESKDDVPKD